VLKRLFFVFFLIFSANARLQAQRTPGSLSGGISTGSNGTIFYIDPMINERMLTAAIPDLSALRDSYRLGPGDIISLSIKGGINIVVRAAQINASGDISIPEVGSINLGGQTINEASQTVQTAATGVIRNARTLFALERPAPQTVLMGIAGAKSSLQTFDRPFRLVELAAMSGYLGEDKIGAIGAERVNLREIEVTDKNGIVSIVDILPAISGLPHRTNNPFILSGYEVRFKMRDDDRWDVAVSGAVMKPQRIPWHPDDSVEDLIKMAGGYRIDADSTSIMVLSQQLGTTGVSGLNTGAFRTLKVQRGDNLIIGFSKRNTFGKIRIVGEVNRPGIYPIEEGKTSLADILAISGGTGDNALKESIIVISPEWPSVLEKSSRMDQNLAGSGKMDRLKTEIPEEVDEKLTDLWKIPPGYRVPIRAGAATSQLYRGPLPFTENLDYLQIEGRVRQNRRIVNLKDQEAIKNIKLNNGDAILIPFDDGHIQVFGQVNNPGLFPRSEGLSIEAYLDMAGGKSGEADASRVFVIKAGSMEWKKPGETSIQPGDAIFVDRKPLRSFEMNRTYDLQRKQFYLSMASTLIGAVTTIILILKVQ
jgi:protein involved in polysaccharide export with SLBB domain